MLQQLHTVMLEAEKCTSLRDQSTEPISKFFFPLGPKCPRRLVIRVVALTVFHGRVCIHIPPHLDLSIDHFSSGASTILSNNTINRRWLYSNFAPPTSCSKTSQRYFSFHVGQGHTNDLLWHSNREPSLLRAPRVDLHIYN